MGKGQAFLNVPDTTARGEIRHLNVVITYPDDEQNVLVVPVCTYREKNGNPLPGQDSSCLLPVGCHPFIKTKSYIRYHNARAMSLVDIFNGLRNGKLVGQQDFDARFVQDMQRGAEDSPFLPEKLKRFFACFL
ncbi:MAG: hypothetical protein LBD48_11800 [Treponema sp.]|jgi:hypothetical protein|nr:hypothetical protein [Treponema sp.]